MRYRLVISKKKSENVNHDIESWQAMEIMANGVDGLMQLDDDVLKDVLDVEDGAVSVESMHRSKPNQECWGIHIKSFAILHSKTLADYINEREQFDELPPGALIGEQLVAPTLSLEQVNQVFAKLVEHDQKHSNNGCCKHVIGADLALSLNNVENELLSLIFNMYELAHAKSKEVPKPPEYDLVNYDSDGKWVGDLVLTAKGRDGRPGIEVRDYLAQGWTREQLIKERYCSVAPAAAPGGGQPAAPMYAKAEVFVADKPELAIGKLLLDLKDGNLPPTVEPLVQLLANLEGGES